MCRWKLYIIILYSVYVNKLYRKAHFLKSFLAGTRENLLFRAFDKGKWGDLCKCHKTNAANSFNFMIFIFVKLLLYEERCDIIVELDMRRCERLPIGETEPFGGIFTEYVRKSGEAFINAESRSCEARIEMAVTAVFLG